MNGCHPVITATIYGAGFSAGVADKQHRNAFQSDGPKARRCRLYPGPTWTTQKTLAPDEGGM